jgi:hypothetical protein
VPQVSAGPSRKFPSQVRQAETAPIDWFSVNVEFAKGANPEFRELRDRKVDLIFGRISDSFSDEDINAEILFRERYVVVASARSKWARFRKITLADLAAEQWLQMPADIELASLIAAGRYLIVLPISCLHFNASLWRLIALPIDLAIDSRRAAILALKNRTLSPVAQLFLGHARAVGNSMMASTAAISRVRSREPRG